MNIISLIGYIAGIGTTMSFLPQVIATIKNTGEKPSFGMLCIHTTGVGLWTLYGILVKNNIIIIYNATTCGFCFIIIGCLVKSYFKKEVVRSSEV